MAALDARRMPALSVALIATGSRPWRCPRASRPSAATVGDGGAGVVDRDVDAVERRGRRGRRAAAELFVVRRQPPTVIASVRAAAAVRGQGARTAHGSSAG